MTFPLWRITSASPPCQCTRLLLRIRDLETVPPCAFDHPAVADLAARFGIEGSLGNDQRCIGTFARLVDLGVAGEHGEHFGLRRVDEIPDEAARQRTPSAELRHARAAAGGCLLRLAGPRALLGHRLLETRAIDLDAVGLEEVLGQIERQSVSVVEFEGGFARQRTSAARSQRAHLLLENRPAAAERLGKAGFFGADHLLDLAVLGTQLRVRRAEAVDHRPRDSSQEWPGKPEVLAVTRGAPQDPPQHVSSTFVGRTYAVGDHERERSAVVGDDPERDVDLAAGAVAVAAEAFGEGDHVPQEIGVVVAEHPLQNGRDALETHAGVDVLGRQFLELAPLIAVVLDEHQVPQLDEPRTATVHRADVPRRLTTVAAARAAIDVDLRARAARPGLAHLPEVVLFAEAQDAVAADVRGLAPPLLGFVVRLVDGHPEVCPSEASRPSVSSSHAQPIASFL